MSRWTRRQFIRSAGLGLAAAAALPRARASAPPRRPRCLVQIYLSGGVDAILTTNPKLRTEVAPVVEIPYEPQEIRQVGAVRVGPLLAGLERHVPKMAILNGVNCSTVSHVTGTQQTAQMRRLSPPLAPSLIETVGRLQRRGAPLDAITFVQAKDVFLRPPTAPGRSLTLTASGAADNLALIRLAKMAKDGARWPVIERALRDELRACDAPSYCRPLEESLALLTRLRELEIPDPKPVPVPDDPTFGDAATKARVGERVGGFIRNAVYILANRISPTLFVPIQEWDTHSDNLALQTDAAKRLVLMLGSLLDAFETARTIDGTLLADEVAVIISSELGRFPILNAMKGKDHFPEIPMVFIGPGIRPGQYGETDRNLVATPISFQRGLPSSSARDAVPTIDDVGATILTWFGCEDPSALGYVGRRLDFLSS
jgi:hypothetical protein